RRRDTCSHRALAGRPVTAVVAWASALRIIEERARLIGDGFGVEVALVWPWPVTRSVRNSSSRREARTG
ncbi:MAG: hypothetical protein M3R63_10660, partial [Actinomycetota bacterium]|nr:hypothetical protein [Actinomycetota bacterium]